MKIAKLFLSACICLSAGIYANAQSADDIIAKYVNALGGKDVLGKITSLVTENSITVMGNESSSTTTILAGKGFKLESEFNGQKIINVTTDKGGWVINPMSGSTEATDMPKEQYDVAKYSIYPGGLLANYAQFGAKAALVDSEKVNDVQAYKIKITTAEGTDINYFIDTKTYYLLQFVTTANVNGNEMDITYQYSNYKITPEGFAVAYDTTIDYGGQFQISSTVKKITVNAPVDATFFDKPKS